jgi:hypothetical protein
MIEGQQNGFARLRVNNAVVPCLHTRMHGWRVLSEIGFKHLGAAAESEVSGHYVARTKKSQTDFSRITYHTSFAKPPACDQGK